MNDKPNKPGSDFDDKGEDQAVKNQSVVSPDDYPDTDGGKPGYKDRNRATGIGS